MQKNCFIIVMCLFALTFGMGLGLCCILCDDCTFYVQGDEQYRETFENNCCKGCSRYEKKAESTPGAKDQDDERCSCTCDITLQLHQFSSHTTGHKYTPRCPTQRLEYNCTPTVEPLLARCRTHNAGYGLTDLHSRLSVWLI